MTKDTASPKPPKPRKPWAALGVVVVLLVAGGLAGSHFLLPPRHLVRTLIRVPPQTAQFLPLRENAPDLATYQRNQMALVKSRLVLNSALREPKVTNLPSITNMIDPVEWLEKQIHADFTVAPDIIKISMRGKDTDEMVVLVNAVREAYLREVSDERQASRIGRQTVLQELIQRYKNELKGAREAQRDDEEKIGGKNVDARARKYAFLVQSLAKAEQELLTTRSKLRDAKVKLAGLEAREKAIGKEPVPDGEVNEALSRERTVAALAAEASRLEVAIVTALSRSKDGEKDPEVAAARTQLKKFQAEADKVREGKARGLREQLKAERHQRLLADLAKEKANVASLTNQEAYLEADIKRHNEALGTFGKAEGKLDDFTAEISHLEALLKQLRTEQEAIKVELAAPTRVRVLEQATISRGGG